jgi:glycine cleavage system H protein
MEIQGYQMPEELYYEENHYWVRVEGESLVMGMDDFAQKLAGQIVFVQLPFEGKKLQKGKKFAQVESGKWLGKIFAPVDGEIIESNSALEDNAALINEDCYGKGWMFRIRPDDPGQVQQLIHGVEAVTKWLVADIAKYKKD